MFESPPAAHLLLCILKYLLLIALGYRSLDSNIVHMFSKMFLWHKDIYRGQVVLHWKSFKDTKTRRLSFLLYIIPRRINMSRRRPTCKLQASIKEKPASQVVLKRPILLFYCLCRFKAVLSSLDSSSGLSSAQIKDERMEPCLRNEAHLCHMPSPLAFSILLLLPAKAPCLSLYPLFIALAMAGILPLCIPLSIHYAIPPSMSLSQRQRSGVWVGLAALSEECNWTALQKDLETCAPMELPSCLFCNSLARQAPKQVKEAIPAQSRRYLRRRMANFHQPQLPGADPTKQD